MNKAEFAALAGAIVAILGGGIILWMILITIFPLSI